VSEGGAEWGSPGEALQRLRDIEPEPKWLIQFPSIPVYRALVPIIHLSVKVLNSANVY